jgi:hypothetical protein
MFSVPELILSGIKGIGSRFHNLPVRTRFRRSRGRRVPFSCFARPDSFSTVPRAPGPVLMFCAFGLVFGGTEGDGYRFHALRARTHFRRYRGRLVPFSSFARPDSFLAVSRASGPFFKFCSFRLIFVGTEDVGSHFHLLRSRTCFRRCQVRRVPFSCFVLPKSFSTVTSASGPVFMFALPDSFSVMPSASCPIFMLCVPVLIFDGTEGVRSRFHVLCARTHFRRYRGRRVPFSCFALPDSFSAVPRSSGSVFMFFAPGLIFNGTEGVGSRFHVLRSPTYFLRYRGRRVPFSCFALPDSFSAVPSVGYLFHVLCVGSRSNVLRTRTHFRRYRGRRVPFSCFALPNSFSAVPRTSSPVFMFSVPGLIFGGTEGFESRFHILPARTRFR